MQPTPTPKQATGNFGEELAARHLKKKGLKLLARNWRKGSYELDLICAGRDTLVFVEVKTRCAGGLERPDEALTPAKRQSLLRAAQEYLQETGAWDAACRFDLISVILYNGSNVISGGYKLEHLEDVLDFNSLRRGGRTLGGGHAPWQPW